MDTDRGYYGNLFCNKIRNTLSSFEADPEKQLKKSSNETGFCVIYVHLISFGNNFIFGKKILL